MKDNRELKYHDRCLLIRDKLSHLIECENRRQLDKWGIQSLTLSEWSLILSEEIGELQMELCKANFSQNDIDKQKHLDQAFTEAIQSATLILKIAEICKSELPKEC